MQRCARALQRRCRWASPDRGVPVSSHRLAQFASSVDDENPRHLAGEFASPVFAHVPVMQSMVEVLKRAVDGFVLHGEHDFVFHQPIVPGQRLFTNSTLIGVRGNRAGITYIVRSDTLTHTGESVCPIQHLSRSRGGLRSRRAMAHRNPRSPEQLPRPRTTLRPTRPAAMPMRRAIILRILIPLRRRRLALQHRHGMCTLAFAVRHCDRHCDGDTPRLKRLGCRFAHPPADAGQTISVDHWAGMTDCRLRSGRHGRQSDHQKRLRAGVVMNSLPTLERPGGGCRLGIAKHECRAGLERGAPSDGGQSSCRAA